MRDDVDLERGNAAEAAPSPRKNGAFRRTTSMEQLIPLDIGNGHQQSSLKSTIIEGAHACQPFMSFLQRFLQTTKVFWIVVIYTIAGARFFMWLEVDKDVEQKREAHQYHLVARAGLLFRIRSIEEDRQILEKEQHLKEAIIDFERNIGLQLPIEPPDTAWTFWMALLYSASIYTTVGYGNIACATTAGRVTSIFYAILGIPLMIVVLDQLGDFLLKKMKTVTYLIDDTVFFLGVRYHLVRLNDRQALARYISVCRRLAALKLISGTISVTLSEVSITSNHSSAGELANGSSSSSSTNNISSRTHNKVETAKKSFRLKIPATIDDDAEREMPSHGSSNSSSCSQHSNASDSHELKPSDVSDLPAPYAGRRDPPVMVALMLTSGWIAMSAAIFTFWEEWSFFTSMYFFFISMSTIGFGDIVPAQPQYMMATFFLIIVGLSLVSVCINVVQEKFSQIYMGILAKMLQQYVKAQELGDSEAIKEFIDGFNNKAKYLIPLISCYRKMTDNTADQIKDLSRRVKSLERGKALGSMALQRQQIKLEKKRIAILRDVRTRLMTMEERVDSLVLSSLHESGWNIAPTIQVPMPVPPKMKTKHIPPVIFSFNPPKKAPVIESPNIFTQPGDTLSMGGNLSEEEDQVMAAAPIPITPDPYQTGRRHSHDSLETNYS